MIIRSTLWSLLIAALVATPIAAYILMRAGDASELFIVVAMYVLMVLCPIYLCVAVIMAVLGLVGGPITNSLIRTTEADADRYSLVHFNAPDGLAKALVKTIEYRAATPSALEEALFYDHPAVGVRIRRAMDWKAAHPPTPKP